MRVNNNVKYLAICAATALFALGAEHMAFAQAPKAAAPAPAVTADPDSSPPGPKVVRLAAAGGCQLYKVTTANYILFVTQSTNNLTCGVTAVAK